MRADPTMCCALAGLCQGSAPTPRWAWAWVMTSSRGRLMAKVCAPRGASGCAAAAPRSLQVGVALWVDDRGRGGLLRGLRYWRHKLHGQWCCHRGSLRGHSSHRCAQPCPMFPIPHPAMSCVTMSIPFSASPTLIEGSAVFPAASFAGDAVCDFAFGGSEGVLQFQPWDGHTGLVSR